MNTVDDVNGSGKMWQWLRDADEYRDWTYRFGNTWWDIGMAVVNPPSVPISGLVS